MTGDRLPATWDEIPEWLLERIPWLLTCDDASELSDPEMRELAAIVGGVLARCIIELLEKEYLSRRRRFFPGWLRKRVWRGVEDDAEDDWQLKLEQVFELLEELSNSPNPDVPNFVQVSVYESLPQGDLPLKVFKKLERTFRDRLKPASRRLWEEWAPYIGEYPDLDT
jgi:hypothetical protein